MTGGGRFGRSSLRSQVRGIFDFLFGGIIRRRIFRPDRRPLATLAIDSVAFSVLRLERPDGGSVSGLIAPAHGEARAVVLFLHGNAGNAEKGAREAALLPRAGFTVLVADYRGYGGNAGTPSQDGLLVDAALFLRHAHRLAGDLPVLLAGHSLGGALATLLAAEAPASGLLTCCSPACVADLGPRIAQILIADRFDAQAAAALISIPWIIAHGERDAIAPVADAHRLLAAAKSTTPELLIWPEAGHDLAPGDLLDAVERLLGLVVPVKVLSRQVLSGQVLSRETLPR